MARHPRLLVLALGLVASLVGASPSAAQPASAGEHCIIRVTPATTSAPSSAAEPECYTSFSAAISAATDGRVALADGIDRTTLTDALLNEPDRPVIYGIDYQEPNYGGDSYIMVSDYGGCGQEQSYELPFYTRWWWNDTISSTQAFAGCTVNKLYPDIWWQGVGITCRSDCATLGVMDNRTSSRQWCAENAPCPAIVVLDNHLYLPHVAR